MGTKKKFTPEELKHLQANPYTLRVTADSISYTLAFKETFWALSLQGYTGTAAFRKLGYCQKGSFAVFWGRVSTIDSSGAKAETASHTEQLRFPAKGTGAVFCVTSYSDTGTRRSALLCRCRWGRNDRCLRRW